MALEVNDTNLEEIIAQKDKLIVLDFWAEWCGPCRQISPIIEELSKDYEGKAVIGKVNVDESSECSGRFGIRNIPTVIFIKNGEIVDKQVGANSKASFVEKIEKHL